MSKKRRRPAGQRQSQAAPVEQPAGAVEGSPPADDRRARQIKEWEARKREKERKQRRKAGGAPVGWIVAGAGVFAAAVVGGVLLLSGGGSSSSEEPIVTPDARVAGLPVDETVEILADDDGQATNPRFEPNEVIAGAGEVIEFKVDNVGDVAHNLTVSGLDKEYGTRDDFTLPALNAGESGTLLVKIDEPGQYPFRCDLHPVQQVGTLILS